MLKVIAGYSENRGYRRHRITSNNVSDVPTSCLRTIYHKRSGFQALNLVSIDSSNIVIVTV